MITRAERLLDKSGIAILPYDPAYRDQALAMAAEMHHDSAYASLPFDEDKVARQLAGAFQNGEQFHFRIAVRRGELYGGMISMIFTSLFCDRQITRDVGWWVRQGHRGSAAAVLLLLDFERWSRERGAARMMIGQVSGIHMERTARLYTHCGYTIVGVNAMKELTNG